MGGFAIYFVLLVGVLLIMWLVMAAPVGVRSVSQNVRIATGRKLLWHALHPFGDQGTWHHSAQDVLRFSDHTGRIVTGHTGRDGQPIKRDFVLFDEAPGEGYGLRYTDDTSLASTFWEHHHQQVRIRAIDDGTCVVTLRETDRYRGIAFYVYRYFALRRMTRQLKEWAETGSYTKGGWFDRPITQFAMAALSTCLVWPLFGLTPQGFFLAATLTLIVALHELGHVAAFRISGHETARMVFLPLLGGFAMGGRPYNTHFEIAFAALMGAGFSAFLAAGLWALHATGWLSGLAAQAVLVAALMCALFNLGNILPVWKFDGGQLLRQVFRNRAALYGVSIALLAGLAVFAHGLGVPASVVGIGLAVVVGLTVLTGTNTIKPRHALVPMTKGERALAFAGLLAVITIHASVLQWSLSTLFA
ncbi:MAG: site-2 protease family protein [Pseudomonadota bacterium]